MSSTIAISKAIPSIDALLGGKKVLPAKQRSAMDWIAVVRQGLSSAAIDAMAKTLRVTQSELATALCIPECALARRKKEGRLNSEESAKLVRLAHVVGRAVETFEDLDAALDWLKAPNAALSGTTPLSMLDTDIGAQSVTDTLGRIAHGVVA